MPLLQERAIEEHVSHVVQRGHPGNQLGVEFLQVTSPLCRTPATTPGLTCTRFQGVLTKQLRLSFMHCALLCVSELRRCVDLR